MKAVSYNKRFAKNLNKISNKKLEARIKQRITLFLNNKNNPLLRDHELTGSMKGTRAFSITGDIRIIYQEFDDYYLFLDIGPHSKVYK